MLRAGAAWEGAALRIVADDGRRAVLAAAVETAERHQGLVGERLRELARALPHPSGEVAAWIDARPYARG